MVEVNQSVEPHGFRFDREQTRKDVLQILAIYHSGEGIGNLADTPDDPRKPVFASLLKDYQWTVLVHALIAVASSLRMEIDAKVNAGTFNYRSLKSQLSSAHLETESKPAKDLDFREACNKVMHGQTVSPSTDGGDWWRLTKAVILEGEYQSKRWKATLRLERFCEHALTLCDALRED